MPTHFELIFLWLLSLPFCTEIYRARPQQHRWKVAALGALVGSALAGAGLFLYCSSHRMCGLGNGIGEDLALLLAQFGVELAGALPGALMGLIPSMRRPLVWLWYIGMPVWFSIVWSRLLL